MVATPSLPPVENQTSKRTKDRQKRPFHGQISARRICNARARSIPLRRVAPDQLLPATRLWRRDPSAPVSMAIFVYWLPCPRKVPAGKCRLPSYEICHNCVHHSPKGG